MMKERNLSLAKMAAFFTEMSPEKVSSVHSLYASDASFRDPINEVKGAQAIEEVMADLFRQLKNIRIVVREMLGNEDAGCLIWNMHYQFRGKSRSIPGVSHFRFNQDGKVIAQEDFWDASFVLYGEFPGLGLAMRGIRRMVQVKASR